MSIYALHINLCYFDNSYFNKVSYQNENFKISVDGLKNVLLVSNMTLLYVCHLQLLCFELNTIVDFVYKT